MPNTLRRNFSRYNDSLAKEENKLSGELGIYLNGEKLVEVSNRPGYVYVRLRNNLSEVIQAFNDKVSPTYGLPVLVAREGSRYVVRGRDTERYSNWGTATPFLPKHGNQHSLNFESQGGGDIAFIYSRQFMPLALFPSGSAGSQNLLVGDSYIHQKTNYQWIGFGITGTANLVSNYRPTGSTSIMLLLYADEDTGNIGYIVNSGTHFSNTITGTMEIVPYLPVLQSQSKIPLYGVRLSSGTSILGYDNLYDVRPFFTLKASGSAGVVGGGGFDGYGVAVQSEGGFVISGTVLNFVGEGISVTSSGTVARIYITGSSGGNGNSPWISVYDNSSFIGSGTSFSFDENLSVVISGSVAFISAPNISTTLGLGIIGQNNGTLLGTGTYLNFGDNLTASISGSVIQIDGQAGGVGLSSLPIYDDNTFKVSGTEVSFGQKLVVSVTGTTAYIDVSGIDSVLGLGVVVQKDGTNIGTGTFLNFVGDTYDISISGSVARIDSGIRMVLKPSDTDRTSDTTPTADPHLVIPNLEANTTWAIDGYIASYASGTAPDIKMNFSGPTGSVASLLIDGLQSAAVSGAGSVHRNITELDTDNPRGIVIGADAVLIKGTLIVGGTPGSFTFNWSQNTSSTTPTTVRANSWLRLEKIPP